MTLPDLSLRDHLSDVGVSKWVTELGVAPAPVPQKGIRAALEFFAANLPGLPIGEAVGFLAAMDLSKPVASIVLAPGTRLLGFRTGNESPFKLFFARRGSSKYTSGINSWGREVVHFVVRTPVRALESTTGGAKDSWSAMKPGEAAGMTPRAHKWSRKQMPPSFGVLAPGGGRQLIIPESYNRLLVEER
jgi:hypothetical protein